MGCNLGLEIIDEYIFDDAHHSFVFQYMAKFDKLYRFNYVDDTTYKQIENWLNKTPTDIDIKDLDPR